MGCNGTRYGRSHASSNENLHPERIQQRMGPRRRHKPSAEAFVDHFWSQCKGYDYGGGGGGFGGGGGGAIGEGMNGDNDGHALHARLHTVEVGLMSMRDSFQQGLDRQMAYMRVMNGNVRRIAVQPGARPAAANNGRPALAQLSPLPRNLHALWQEYTDGVGGRKAARLFTAQERGQNKYKYHRRKVVWEVISRLVRGGRTAQTSIDMVYNVYGYGSVTSIINRMRRDRANGGHPNLQ